jgi:hypothetical protein
LQKKNNLLFFEKVSKKIEILNFYKITYFYSLPENAAYSSPVGQYLEKIRLLSSKRVHKNISTGGA